MGIDGAQARLARLGWLAVKQALFPCRPLLNAGQAGCH